MSGERWTEVNAAEAARHERTVAVAQRIALHEATIMLDARAAEIAKAHPGRAKGSLSAEGRKLHDAVKSCAEMVLAMYESISVPDKDGPVYVPSRIFDREKLEAEVERQVPGTYPDRRSALNAAPTLTTEAQP